jgi:hypothetical protein
MTLTARQFGLGVASRGRALRGLAGNHSVLAIDLTRGGKPMIREALKPA